MAAGLAACAPQPEPRTVSEFMEDGLARDGVLARCNQDREATLTDAECANARRAAAAVALEAERGREPKLERESEVKLAAFDVYADGAQPLGRRALEIEAAVPPTNDLEIESPELVLTDLAIPRPFRSDDAIQQ
jgi:hypothetical protein